MVKKELIVKTRFESGDDEYILTKEALEGGKNKVRYTVYKYVDCWFEE